MHETLQKHPDLLIDHGHLCEHLFKAKDFTDLDESIIKILNSRIRKKQDITASALHYFDEYADAYNFNNAEIMTRAGSIEIAEAIDKIVDDNGEKMTNSLKHAISKMSKQYTGGLASTVLVQKSIRYMLTKDINRDNGLVAGMLGTIRSLGFNQKKELEILWFEFPRQKIDAKQSINDKRTRDSPWIPIGRESCLFSFNDEITIQRRQFPIKAYESFHTHSTLPNFVEKIAIDLSCKMTPKNLSRVLSLLENVDDLYLYGANSVKFL
jgi:hypothetical protein